MIQCYLGILNLHKIPTKGFESSGDLQQIHTGNKGEMKLIGEGNKYLKHSVLIVLLR